MQLRMALLAALATLAMAAPAAADTFTVTGVGDAPSPPPCAPAGTSGAFECSTLRAAVAQANATSGADSIVVPPGQYGLTAGGLTLTDEIAIAGLGTRQTELTATGGPVFAVASGATATFSLITVRGGTSAISVAAQGSLNLSFSRVTGAASDAGIASAGSVILAFSLVDGNGGGGIRSVGVTGDPADVTVGASTIAANNGPGIRSDGFQNSLNLINATVARNVGAGLSFDSVQDTSATGSIIADNGGGNCTGGVLTGTSNVESAASCGLSADANRLNASPGLSVALTNAGGFTDVLTIPASSPAADYLVPCTLGSDQRGFQMPANQPCDAGAYDRDAVDPGLGQDQGPGLGPGPEPTPTPTPTPQPPAPTPVPDQSAVVREQRGTVRVQLPGTKTFVDLDATRGLPMGSTVDTRKGAIEITTVPKAGAPPEKAVFSEGLFKLTQSKGITNLTLVEPLDCARQRARASAAQKKAKKRRLWGDGKGSFRTTGRYSAATVRGTKWLVEDTCTTTTTRVTQGSVTVTHGKKRVVVRAGKRYVARAKKR